MAWDSEADQKCKKLPFPRAFPILEDITIGGDDGSRSLTCTKLVRFVPGYISANSDQIFVAPLRHVAHIRHLVNQNVVALEGDEVAIRRVA